MPLNIGNPDFTKIKQWIGNHNNLENYVFWV